MFLAGTSVYSHPDGPAAGAKAIIAAWRAYALEGIVVERKLKEHTGAIGAEGKELLRPLG